MKLAICICVAQFVLTLGHFRNERGTLYIPANTRLRHSRHLDNFTPIRSVPSLIAGPNSKLAVKDNHKPVFKDCSSYRPVVKEESPIGTYVFTVQAIDSDPPHSGGTITYKFVTTPGEKERFFIEANSGSISTADIFDHDEPSREKEVYITVRVTDNGQPSLDDACTIKIIIEDINDNPPVFDKVSYSESVPQDLQLNQEVMRISATDIDEGDNSIVHYSLDPSSPDASYFHIDPANGVIFLNKTIDKPPGYNFKLSAIVKDNGDPPQQSSITLDVQVVESNKKSPSFTEVPEDVIYLKENHSDFKTPIATVRAISNIPDEDTVRFELVRGQTQQTNRQHTFLLMPDGQVAFVILGQHLDYEEITEYTLTIRIQNNYRLAAETIINIQVLDVNDNTPIFSEIRSGTVLENEPVGTQVMQVRAIDFDGTAENNQVTYALGDPTDPFAIDPVTGNITTLKMLDREEKSFYNIKILATDNSPSAVIPDMHNTAQQFFNIEIADKNDNPPHFTQDTYIAESIAENANINELVTQVSAIDVDTASIVRYSIVSGNTYESFTIRNFTGEIRVNKGLDYENLTSFSLDVRAYDGVYEDFATVIIKIENLNDNPPVFVTNYTKTIEEEKLYEGCIVRVEAYDPDIKDRNAPQNIVYSLVKHEQKEFLDIDNDGCLRLNKPLDRDQPTGFTRWQILIMAADHGGRLGSDSLRSTTEVILELTDINDNAPFLTNTQPVVWYENEPTGQVVVLTAKDYDSPENGPPFTFALNETANYLIKSKFQIQGNILYAISSFDREFTKEYFIPILITDSGTPRMTGMSILHVVIGDKNDNAMASGFSSVFVYNYKGEAPDTEIGRVYVEDPDDWDIGDKRFMWLPSYELRSPYFDVQRHTGMITMREGTPNGTYTLRFNVTEQNDPLIPFHWVEATVNVTVKEIPEEAVDKSGSVRFVNITAEDFIVAEADGFSKKEKFHRRLAKLFNVSLDNVDVFTVSNKQTVEDEFLDVRFSAHGSPYYSPEKLNTMLTGIQDQLEDELSIKIFMVHIDECLIEREQCENSCRNVLIKNNVPLAVYTNTTSFIGVSARVESECTCQADDQLICLNGGTPFADKCECPEGYLGPRCEQTSVGFHGDGWAMYPPPPACSEGHVSLTVTAHTSQSLIFYMGPLKQNSLLNVEDFLSLELIEGYPVLLVNYGSGTTRINNSVVYVADGKPHLIEIILMTSSIEMFVDRCKLTTCMSLAAPTGNKEILNINGPLQLGGSSVDLEALGKDFNWRYVPNDQPLVGCITNFTYNEYMYNLGEPSYHKNADPSCQRSMFTAVTFGIDTNFLVAILVCSAILIGLYYKYKRSHHNEDAAAAASAAPQEEDRDGAPNLRTTRCGTGTVALEAAHPDSPVAGPSSSVAEKGVITIPTQTVYHPATPKIHQSLIYPPQVLPPQLLPLQSFPPQTGMRMAIECGAPNPRTTRCGTVAALPDSPIAGPSSSVVKQRTIQQPLIYPRQVLPPQLLPLQSFPPQTGMRMAIECGAPNPRTTRCGTVAAVPDSPIAGPSSLIAKRVITIPTRIHHPATRKIHQPLIYPPQVLPPQLLPSQSFPPQTGMWMAIECVLLLAVVVHRRRQDTWAEKELDDIRENIIAYEDEGGGEGDAGYDLHVLRQMYEGPPTEAENWRSSGAPNLRTTRCGTVALAAALPDSPIAGPSSSEPRVITIPTKIHHPATPTNHLPLICPPQVLPPQPLPSQSFPPQAGMRMAIECELVGAAPDISGFLDDKKEVMDRDPDAVNPFDDVRHYAYEGDGNTSGSLSSLASCTDDGDLKFNYLSTFGPRFRKLADMYGDSDDEGRHDRRDERRDDRRDLSPQEESWC